jgi:ATP-dependent protease ClpP protease subunit
MTDKQPPRRALTYSRVLEEAQQGHLTRIHLYNELEKQLDGKCAVVSFFTMFGHPRVLLENSDADMLEEVLQNYDMGGRQLALILNCPGGDGLAAERIITICRSFSKDGYTVIVPKQAKSAATMICLGAKNIVMSSTSELGPIDPQISFDGKNSFAAHEIIESYEALIKQATKAKGRIDPFLQQLQRFDARDIRWVKSAQQLSDSIAVRALQTGAMKKKSPKAIRSKIKPFLNPQFTKVHGRPIYHDVAEKCGLPVTLYEIQSEFWRTIWELYVRLNYAVSGYRGAKIVESRQDHYVAPVPQTSDDEN